MQRLFADTAVEVALAVVYELLPSELQPIARRLIALHNAIWHRGIQPAGGEEP